MTNPAIPDVISVVGSAYLQPITDLLENLLKQPISGKGPEGVTCRKWLFFSAGSSTSRTDILLCVFVLCFVRWFF